MTNTPDILLEVGAALGDLVEQTPMAPEWHDLEAGLQRLSPQPPPRRWKGLTVALTAAVVAFVAIGAITLLAPARDRNDAATSSTTPPATTQPEATPTTMVTVPPERLNLRDQIGGVTASSHLPGFAPSNLIDGSTDTAWNDGSLAGEGAALTFEFPAPVYIDTIVITNLQDETALLRNYRIKDIEIEFRTVGGPEFVSSTAPGSADPHIVDAGVVHQGPLVIRVLTVWPAEAVDDKAAFYELAVAEVEFYGSTVPDLETDELEVAIRETELMIQTVEIESSNLEEALATAEGDAAKELQDRIAATKAVRLDLIGQAERLQDELDALTNYVDP